MRFITRRHVLGLVITGRGTYSEWPSKSPFQVCNGWYYLCHKYVCRSTQKEAFLGSIAKSKFLKITRKMSYRLLLTFGSCLCSFDFSRPGMAVLLNNVDCFGVCFVPPFVFFVVFGCCKLEMPRRHRRIMKSWLKYPGLRTCYKEH